MLVITEISEAVEALRCGNLYGKLKCPEVITSQLLNCFEYEIADVFIRLFDLCGYLKIESEGRIHPKSILPRNITEQLFDITKGICLMSKNLALFKDDIFRIISDLKWFCERNNIDIEKHIDAKMEYNKTRPKKHNKEF